MCLIAEDGTTLWSSKVVNDETAGMEAIGEVGSRASEVAWAVDVTGTMSGLLLALLAAHDETDKGGSPRAGCAKPAPAPFTRTRRPWRRTSTVWPAHLRPLTP